MQNHTEKEALAIELAEALKDADSLAFYRRCVERYPEEVLRRIVEKVLSIPQHKITKTRGALFNSLLSNNGKKSFRPWA